MFIKWRVTPKIAQIMCSQVRIKEVTKFEKAWVMPINTEKSTDSRVVLRKYVDWRGQQKMVNVESM